MNIYKIRRFGLIKWNVWWALQECISNKLIWGMSLYIYIYIFLCYNINKYLFILCYWHTCYFILFIFNFIVSNIIIYQKKKKGKHVRNENINKRRRNERANCLNPGQTLFLSFCSNETLSRPSAHFTIARRTITNLAIASFLYLSSVTINKTLSLLQAFLQWRPLMFPQECLYWNLKGLEPLIDWLPPRACVILLRFTVDPEESMLRRSKALLLNQLGSSRTAAEAILTHTMVLWGAL